MCYRAGRVWHRRSRSAATPTSIPSTRRSTPRDGPPEQFTTPCRRRRCELVEHRALRVQYDVERISVVASPRNGKGSRRLARSLHLGFNATKIDFRAISGLVTLLVLLNALIPASKKGPPGRLPRLFGARQAQEGPSRGPPPPRPILARQPGLDLVLSDRIRRDARFVGKFGFAFGAL